MMFDDHEFWRLTGTKLIESPEEFHDLLQVSRHIQLVSYRPSVLQATDDPKQSRIQDTTFERVSFSKTCISGFSFRNCTFEHCLFIGAAIRDCEFHNCTFILTNTHKLSISGTYLDPMSFRKCLVPHKHQNIGVHLYQMLLSNSRGTEQIEFERDAQFLFLRWKRFQDGYEIRNWGKREGTSRLSGRFILKCFGYLRRWAWERFFGAGLRLRNFVATVAAAMTGFTMLNYGLREEFGLTLEDAPITSWWEALYYTVVSFTTVGYGDIVPGTHIGQVVASLQSLFGFFLLALLASVLFRKISP